MEKCQAKSCNIQKMLDEIRQAEREAERIISDAESQAEDILSAAEAQAAEIAQSTSALVDALKMRITQSLQAEVAKFAEERQIKAQNRIATITKQGERNLNSAVDAVLEKIRKK